MGSYLVGLFTPHRLVLDCFIRHCNFIQQEMPHKKEGVVRIGILQREGGGEVQT